MRTDPRLLLRGLAKFVAVVVAAGLAGAGIGIALAKLSGNDGGDVPIVPATTERTSTSPGATATTNRSTAGTTAAPRRTTTGPATTATGRASTTGTQTTSRATTSRPPSVDVLYARVSPPSDTTGRAIVALRIRVRNRGAGSFTIQAPVLLSGTTEMRLRVAARGAAGPLLRPLPAGASATGVLRFTVGSAVAQSFAATPSARLRIAGRTVPLTLTTNVGTAP